MASNYPTSIDSFTDPLSNSPLNNPSHAAQHQDVNDAVEKLETKLGVGSSPASGAASGHVLVANGSGSTTWQAPAVTAAQFANVGLTFITSATIGTAVASVTVSNCFSSTYDNYRIIITGGTTSTQINIYLQLSGITTGVYNQNGYYQQWTTSTMNAYAAANATSIIIADGSTTAYAADVEIRNPFASVRKFGNAMGTSAADQYSFPFYINSTASASGFTINPGAGTMTGGTIAVYGYRKG